MEGLKKQLSGLSELSKVDLRKPIDIEDLLVWVYQRQKADVVVESGMGLYPAEAMCDGVRVPWSCHNGKMLAGARVDVSAPAGYKLPADALTVHLAVRKLSALQRMLIIEQAKAGLRPDWMPDYRPRFVPVMNKKRRPKMIYNGENNMPIGCLVEHEVSLELVDFKRTLYARWYDGLVRLSELIEEGIAAGVNMLEYYPIGISAMPAPWRKQGNA